MNIIDFRIVKHLLNSEIEVYSFITNSGQYSEIEFFFDKYYSSRGYKELMSRISAMSSNKKFDNEFFERCDINDKIYSIKQNRLLLYLIKVSQDCVIWGNGGMLPANFTQKTISTMLQDHLDNIKLISIAIKKNNINEINIYQNLNRTIKL